eukprot:jgi/Galph1/3234/GphlegSOOS_G1883.1
MSAILAWVCTGHRASSQQSRILSRKARNYEYYLSNWRFIYRRRKTLYKIRCQLFHSSGQKPRILFLGTPQCAAESLRKLSQICEERQNFTIVSVITQAPSTKPSRKRALSPVQMAAEQLKIPVYTPANINDEFFLRQLVEWKPDLCVTAAYGKLLSQSFLDIPQLGVVNIHPSLLPKYRGAAPVQRALERGEVETGVSLLFTILKMDAGPIIAQQTVKLDGNEKAGKLVVDLFLMGTGLLVDHLEGIVNGNTQAIPQNEEEATFAPKVKNEEGWLTFTENARHIHNKVRAFSDSPGTFANFHIQDRGIERVKIYTTSLVRSESSPAVGIHRIGLNPDKQGLRVTCDDGSQLDILQLQLSGKRIMNARDFYNGLQGKVIERERLPYG